MTNFNRGCLVVNVFTLLLVLSAMGYFWMREVWMVDHLEVRRTGADTGRWQLGDGVTSVHEGFQSGHQTCRQTH